MKPTTSEDDESKWSTGSLGDRNLEYLIDFINIIVDKNFYIAEDNSKNN